LGTSDVVFWHVSRSGSLIRLVGGSAIHLRRAGRMAVHRFDVLLRLMSSKGTAMPHAFETAFLSL
jgi:hypothetical protein